MVKCCSRFSPLQNALLSSWLVAYQFSRNSTHLRRDFREAVWRDYLAEFTVAPQFMPIIQDVSTRGQIVRTVDG